MAEGSHISHFTEVRTVYKDQKALVEALEHAFGKGTVEVNAEGAPLFGYQGDNRALLPVGNANHAPPCTVIVRRRHVGGASNDIGYRRGEDGVFRAYVSDYDTGAARTRLDKIPQRYAVAAARSAARAQGWNVVEVPQKNGTVKLQLEKWGG